MYHTYLSRCVECVCVCVCVYVLLSFTAEANFGPVLTVKFYITCGRACWLRPVQFLAILEWEELRRDNRACGWGIGH